MATRHSCFLNVLYPETSTYRAWQLLKNFVPFVERKTHPCASNLPHPKQMSRVWGYLSISVQYCWVIERSMKCKKKEMNRDCSIYCPLYKIVFYPTQITVCVCHGDTVQNVTACT